MIIMYDMLTTAEHGEPSGPSAMFPATKDTENNERMGGGWPSKYHRTLSSLAVYMG